jgi:hypothetical protein
MPTTEPIIHHFTNSYPQSNRQFKFPIIFHLSVSYEGDYYNLLLKPKRRDDAQNLADCDIINYTNLAEVSVGVPIRDDAGGIIYLRVDNPANPFSLTLRTKGKQDVVLQNVMLDGSCPVGLDWQVTMFITPDKSYINGNANNGENQILS